MQQLILKFNILLLIKKQNKQKTPQIILLHKIILLKAHYVWQYRLWKITYDELTNIYWAFAMCQLQCRLWETYSNMFSASEGLIVYLRVKQWN